MATTYTTESFTIDGVNFKDIQCYGKNNPSINGYASMIRQWIKQKYPKYSGANGVSVTNSKFAGGFSISVDFNRIPEDDFDKIRSEINGFFQATLHSQGYHYTSSGKKHTATNGDVYNIFIKYLDVKNYPKYGSTAYNSPAPDWSSMTEPTKSTTKGTFKKYPKREDFGKFIKECAGWDIYEKNGATYLKKQKDTEPNREKWSEILGYMNTQEGFLWRRNLQAFERNVILNEEQLNMVCALLSRYYTSKQEPTTATPQPISQQPTATTFPPKYFIVKTENTDDYKDYMRWLRKTYDENWGGFAYNWYGVDSDEEGSRVSAYDSVTEFENNPQQFTAKEFMDKLRSSGQSTQQPKTSNSNLELIENQINKLKKLSLISSKEDSELFNNQIEKLNKLLKLLN